MNTKLITQVYVDEGFPRPEFEYLHIPGRKFRLDVAWPPARIGIEIQGGIWSYKPSHSSARGIMRDMEKANLGLLNSWHVLFVIPSMVTSTETITAVKWLWEQYAEDKGE